MIKLNKINDLKSNLKDFKNFIKSPID